MDTPNYDGAAFQVAERWLFNLNKWRADTVVLETNLEDHSGKVTVAYGGIGGSFGGGGFEDGLFDTATGLINDEERLHKLKARVKMIDAAVSSLGYDDQTLVIMKYLEERPIRVICERLIIEEPTFFKRRKRAIYKIIDILIKDHGFRIDIEHKAEINAKKQKSIVK